MLPSTLRTLLLRPPSASPASICVQCLHHLSRSSRRGSVRNFSRGPAPRAPAAAAGSVAATAPASSPRTGSSTLSPEHYFLSNIFLKRRNGSSAVLADLQRNASAPSQNPLSPEDAAEAALPPHRRRKRRKEAAAVSAAADAVIPPDASALLSSAAATPTTSQLRRKFYAYLALSKPRLTALIVLTTMASYALFPVNPLLALPNAPTLSTLTLVYLTAGTALSSASANALNMLFEPSYDAQMSRTRNRPLVRGLLKPRQAALFALASGGLGVATLYAGVNPTVAALGALNIFLYAGVYTPMKRLSVANTWVGAVVGGIPPLMGWAAASGAVAVGGDFTELLGQPGGWLLAALLFAWQFPHFNALSWSIRDEYRAAGYKMMCWKYPGLNARVALRYSLLFFPICAGLWWCGVTDAGFVVDSSVANAWLVREAWRFYRKRGEGGTAKKLFWASVWHLPVVLGLAMVHKAGLWQGVWDRVVGKEEQWEWEELEDEDEAAAEEVGLDAGTNAQTAVVKS